MTPEERSHKLLQKFIPYAKYNKGFGYSQQMEKENAKSCAIICVDEILSVLNESFYETIFDDGLPMEDYWQQVKQEIQKL